MGDLCPILSQLCLDDRGELVLDAAIVDLAARGDEAHFQGAVGGQGQQRGIARRLAGLGHLLFLNDQRDDPHSGQLVALFHGAGVPGGDHHFAQAVHGVEPLAVQREQAVHLCRQLNFALAGVAGVHVVVPAHLAQDPRGLVLMEAGVIFFPDVDMLLAHAQQDRHVLRGNDMAFLEDRAFLDPRDDLGDIVAEHLPNGILRTHQLHKNTLPFARTLACYILYRV